jgi:hypothetical protein
MTHLDPFNFAGTETPDLSAATPAVDPVLDIVRRLADAQADRVEADRCYKELKAAAAAAADVKAAFDEVDDRCDAAADISLEFADATATTLPGLVAHIEALATDLGYGDLSDRLCSQAAAAARSMAAGAPVEACPDLPSWERPAATLPALLDQLRLLEAVLTDEDKCNAGWNRIIRREPETESYEPDLPIRVCRQILAGVEAMIACGGR